MQTQLDIDIGVLEELEKISARTKTPTGKIVSQVLRDNLPIPKVIEKSLGEPVFRNGVKLLPADGREVVTTEFVRKLIEETEDQ